MSLRRFVVASMFTSLLVSVAGAAPATFAELELPSGGWTDLEVLAVSGDGRVLAGNLYDASNTPHAYRWTRTTGFQIAPTPFRASALSRNGAAVLGSRQVPGSSGSFSGFAVRWVGNQVTDIVGPSANTVWTPTATNADGTIATLTGLLVSPFSTTRVGHIWAANPPANLVQPAPEWTVYDLADDASVLVGQSAPSSIFGGNSNLYRPYQRDVLGTVMTDLRAPSGVEAEGEATRISGDGSTIVGRLTEGNSLEPRRAFMWTAAGGTQYLSSALGNDASVFPRGISYRGDLIVGEEHDGPNFSVALIWRGFGAEELIGVLRQQGAEIPDPAGLDRAQAISADGLTIIGQGHLNFGHRFWFIATLATPCDADQDDGSGLGFPDGGVTTDDLLFYLTQFETGRERADLDDGSGTGTRDGGVSIDDLLYFLIRFEAGC